LNFQFFIVVSYWYSIGYIIFDILTFILYINSSQNRLKDRNIEL
jgi:hypothetical protein